MNQIHEMMFQLLKSSLFPNQENKMDFSGDYDWNTVFQEMKQQTVEASVYPLLNDLPAHDPVLSGSWRNQCLLQQARWIQILYAQNQLLDLLSANHIPCVILKGAAAAIYYPDPILRVPGDVDFLVKRKDYQKTAALLEQNGYILTEEKKVMEHHYSYVKDDVSFELHHRLAIISNSDEKLLSLFESGIDKRETGKIRSYVFPVLPPDLNGLVLLFHINQHLRSGLGLRQIIDWMMYLVKMKGTDRLSPIIRETGMEKLANTVTVLCQKYLGLERFVSDEDEYPYEELTEYILAKGNFGQKAGKEGKISYVFLSMSTPVQAFKRLQKGGMSRWKAAKKHKLLMPFAWLYQINYIIKQLIKNHVSIHDMVVQHNIGLEQRALILELGLDVERIINIQE